MITQSRTTTAAGRDALLRRLYAEQGVPADRLAGTRQLRELTFAYTAATGIPVDETLMLRRLRAMAREGELDPPSDTKGPDVNDLILGTLREHGPLSEDMLAVLAGNEGVRTAAEAMAERNELTVIHYTKPDGRSVGNLYLHPGSKFRVANFR